LITYLVTLLLCYVDEICQMSQSHLSTIDWLVLAAATLSSRLDLFIKFVTSHMHSNYQSCFSDLPLSYLFDIISRISYFVLCSQENIMSSLSKRAMRNVEFNESWTLLLKVWSNPYSKENPEGVVAMGVAENKLM